MMLLNLKISIPELNERKPQILRSLLSLYHVICRSLIYALFNVGKPVAANLSISSGKDDHDAKYNINRFGRKRCMQGRRTCCNCCKTGSFLS
jgi:hypothetical protein